ncbi:threonylcarbamoyl-AMP synthase [Silvanigrella aquatica]|uniref:Threonylcarbamoyl-AMP synthase n=2 Tax=Silvanigrella aquatica TaxID=1915309 RepID=A0A1L4D2F6_9BACT|nr:threonylcarbamoyl-AMP synthase [Silvanigrella aquatica]
MTQVLSIHQKNPDKRRIKEVIEILDGGGIVLAPSETGYCFIGSASQDSTHDKLLRLRPGHPKNKPFSLLCKDISQVSKIANLNTQTFRIATRAWPGPYTFVLPSTKNTPKIASGSKRKTVGIRISNHPIISSILHELQYPLLVTSVTDEDELIAQEYFENKVEQDFWWTNVTDICHQTAAHGRIDLAIEINEIVPIHVSTIVDFTENPPQLLRDGGWELEFLGIFE